MGFRVWDGIIADHREAHTHSDMEWNLLLEGCARYFMAGRFQPLTPGRLAVFWGGIPHRLVDYAPGSRMVWVTLPVAWCMEWGLRDALLSRLLSGEMVREPEAARGTLDAALLLRWSQDMRSGAAHRRTAAVLEIQARLHRLIDAMGAQRSISAEPRVGDHVERLSASVGLPFREDLTIEQIAGAAGLHPNYAMSLFKRGCGMSLWDYVIRLRISHAQRLLLTSDAKITAIALDSGFNSLSRFYEAFTRIAGCSPRSYCAAMAER